MKDSTLKLLVHGFGIIAALYATSINAYEIDTHADMSREAAKLSELGKPNSILRSTLGLKYPIEENIHQVFPNSRNQPQSVLELIRDGARFEDDFPRPLNHFYSPTTFVKGLRVGVTWGDPSPDWALEDDGEFTGWPGSLQEFSLLDARRYLYHALTAEEPGQREWYFGRTFQTLGQVIHHIQDMAQPQHVRNDQHLLGINPSLYENYTNRDTIRLKLPFAGYAPVVFDNARHYWVTDEAGGTGEGLAEFTNNNFVSAGTNFTLLGQEPYPHRRYALPVPNGITESIPIETLYKQLGQPVPVVLHPETGVNGPLSGNVDFVGTDVVDHHAGTIETNKRAASLSIFDADLEQYNTTWGCDMEDDEEDDQDEDVLPPMPCRANRLFTLNRFNFDAAHKFLAPRAVAYSTGLINYFFRGRLQAEGAFFTDTGISLRVKNAIDAAQYPQWAQEALAPGGQLQLAFEYKLNGETVYGRSPAVALDEALGPGETSSRRYAFTLAPLPEGAGDAQYRLLYRGRLGQEPDGLTLGRFTPAGRFIVDPANPQARHLYKQGGRWRSVKQPGDAGNIDWRGGYENGRATRVLSWHGPIHRAMALHPADPQNPGAVFSVGIYRNGALFARAPQPVLGAAITENGGQAWLLAVCQAGTADVVYRRPATPSLSAALYDPVSAPAGWQEMGRFDHTADFLEADRPWFFNGDGTEAQTLRRFRFPADESGYKIEGLNRLKLSISGGHAQVQYLGHTPIVNEYSEQVACPVHNPDTGDQDCSASIQFSHRGEYVVAVDYDNMQERLATYIADSRISWTSSWSTDGEFAFNERTEFQGETHNKLVIGAQVIDLETSNNRLVYLRTGQKHTETTSGQGAVTSLEYLDARNGFMVTETQHNQGDSLATFDPAQGGVRNLTHTTERQFRLAGPVSETIHANSFSFSVQQLDIVLASPFRLYQGWELFSGGPFTYSRQQTSYSPRSVPKVWPYDGINGSYATGTGGEVFVSLVYKDWFTDIGQPSRPFQFLSGGDASAVLAPLTGHHKLGVLH